MIPLLLSLNRGLDISETYVLDIFKEQSKYQRACVFLRCGGNTLVCWKRKTEAGSRRWTYLCWERSWCAARRSMALLSGPCSHRNTARKQGQKETSTVGQPCPHPTVKDGEHPAALELSPWFPRGTGPWQDLPAATTSGQAVITLMARPPQRWCWGGCGVGIRGLTSRLLWGWWLIRGGAAG